MSILRGLRYPTALAFGLFLTASIFWGLWSFTNVTFQIIDVVKARPIEFSRTRVDTPTETKFQDEEILEPPVIKDIRIGPLTEGPSVDVIPAFVPATIDTRNIGDNRITFGKDSDAMPLVRVNPVYPPRALAREIEGWVQVQFTITGTGSVRDVIVVDSSPPNVFDAAAVDAVNHWRYNPKVEWAVAVDRVGVQTLLRFDLEE